MIDALFNYKYMMYSPGLGVLCSCNNNLIHNGFHHHYPQSYVMLCVLSVSAATMNRWQIKPSIFSIYLSPHWQSFKFNWRLSNIFVTVAVLIFIFKYFYDTNVAVWRSRWCNWLSAPVLMMKYTTRVTLNTPLDHGINPYHSVVKMSRCIRQFLSIY